MMIDDDDDDDDDEVRRGDDKDGSPSSREARRRRACFGGDVTTTTIRDARITITLNEVLRHTNMFSLCSQGGVGCGRWAFPVHRGPRYYPADPPTRPRFLFLSSIVSECAVCFCIPLFFPYRFPGFSFICVTVAMISCRDHFRYIKIIARTLPRLTDRTFFSFFFFFLTVIPVRLLACSFMDTIDRAKSPIFINANGNTKMLTPSPLSQTHLATKNLSFLRFYHSLIGLFSRRGRNARKRLVRRF